MLMLGIIILDNSSTLASEAGVLYQTQTGLAQMANLCKPVGHCLD